MSEFKFACPVCGQHITCDSGSSGEPMDCPTCFRKLVVPHASINAPANLVLTAALFQSRPATTLGSQTEVIARQLSAAKRVRMITLAVIVLVLLVVAVVLALHLSRVQNIPPAATDAVGLRLPDFSDGLASAATNWTLNLAQAKIPDEPASGRVDGRGFELQRVILRWKIELGEPVTEDDHHGYALRVEVGAVSGNQLPGKIYLAMPDDLKSDVAGTFNADIRKPPSRQQGGRKMFLAQKTIL